MKTTSTPASSTSTAVLPRPELEEVKLDIAATPKQVLNALGVKNQTPMHRTIYFFDDATLSASKSGLVVRARAGAESGDFCIKLRPFFDASRLSPEWKSIPGFKCEPDEVAGNAVDCAQLTIPMSPGAIQELVDGGLSLDQVLSEEQKGLLKEYMPEALEMLSSLNAIGPVETKVWKLKPSSVSAKVTQELWDIPNDDEPLLELSVKVDPKQKDLVVKQIRDLLQAAHLSESDDQRLKQQRVVDASQRATDAMSSPVQPPMVSLS